MDFGYELLPLLKCFLFRKFRQLFTSEKYVINNVFLTIGENRCRKIAITIS